MSACSTPKPAVRRALIVLVSLVFAAPQTLPAQTTAGNATDKNDAGWRSLSTGKSGGSAAAGNDDITPIGSTPAAANDVGATIARVTKGNGQLPNDHGQIWREYDISPYTLRVTATKRPEQAIVDWVLRETGYEVWHGETAALLSADKRTLRVYHTPEVQQVIADVVDRFVSSKAETEAFSLRVVTVQDPNWRASAHRLMQPVDVQSPGVQAWLMAKEDAALLVAKLRKRTDFREHGSPHLLVNNGQSTVLSAWKTINYVKDAVVAQRNNQLVLEPSVAGIDEGFALEFTPLLSVDGQYVEAIVKCNIDQVERMVPVVLDLPVSTTQSQRFKIEVPQMTNARLHEKFRWPTDKVLVVSRGVVATPVPGQGSSNPLKLPFVADTPPRADAVVFIQSKGKEQRISDQDKTADRPRRRF